MRRVVLLGVLVLIALAVVWTGWTAYRVNDELTAATDDAARLEAAVRAGDTAALDGVLGSLTDHADRAADLTDGPVWTVLTWLPAVGDDARGVRAVSSVAAGLGSDGLRPLADSADRLGGLLPTGGQVDLTALEALQAPVAQSVAALDTASRRLAEEDPDGFVDRLGDRYRELAARVDGARAGLASADTALQVMPSMLGADGPRRFLLVSQNNAEVRATGGLPGAVTALETDGGRIELGRQVAAGSFGSTEQPVLPLSDAERRIYGEVLGTFFLDATMTPDFPRAAALMQARWQQQFPEEPLDGVVTVDPVALSYLLRVTGPVDVDGISLDADTVVDELLHETYLRIAEPAEQDAFFQRAAAAIFDRLVAGGAGSPTDVLRALTQGAREHRVLVHSFDADEQAVLQPTVVSGALVTDPAAPAQVGVYLNDLTGAKMSYYLRNQVVVDATSCDGGVQTYAGRATLRSDAPADVTGQPDYVTGGAQFGTPVGSQTVFVRLHGPAGGAVGPVTLDGEKLVVDKVDQDGRVVVTTALQLAPGESLDLGWTMTSGPGQTGDTQVSVTPGVEPGSASSTAASVC